MSRKGDCLENPLAESFCAKFKTEALGDAIPADHDAATLALASAA